jgi:hypothetical protein
LHNTNFTIFVRLKNSKMNKKTKTAIGIGAVAIVGYLIYRKYEVS